MPSEERVQLPGSYRAAVEGASTAGPVPSTEVIQVTVIVRRKNGSELPPLEDFAYRGGRKANYLTREEFAKKYGADAADLAAVGAFASQYGLTVAEQNQARRSVVLLGTVGNMQAAFGTSLEYFESPAGKYRGRTGYLTLPSNLAQIVSAVVGLDDRPVAKMHLRRRRRAAQPSGLSPLVVAQAYNFPSGAQGSGQTIGILELGGGYSTSDLSTYFSGLGIKAPTVSSVSVDGAANQPGVDTDADAEVMLDIEVAGAVAPGAHIVVYFAPNTDQGFIDAITTAAQDTTNKPSVLSISWGGPEDSWTSASATAMLNACTDAAAVGVTVTAAAGDDGATDGETGLHVDLPACLPPVLGCGGTKLTLHGSTISSEVVWNELSANEGATGGGVSQVYAIPSYQASAGVPLQPGSTFVGRGVPDVASDADPNTGYEVLVDGQSEVIGGTSAAAPLWAGLIALLNQELGKPVGFVQPALYQIGEAAFRDITSGNNDGYSAGKGWDACTGLGTPNGAALLKALQGLSSSTGKRKGKQAIES